jgi:hypothetical protein
VSKMRLLFSQGLLLASCLLLSIAGCGGSAASNETGQGAPEVLVVEKSDVATATGPGIAMAARKQAADEGKYLFAFFSKTEDESTTAMRSLFNETMAKVTDRANAVTVNVTDLAEKEIVAEYDLDRAPMPLVLAIAPNGAITGGFPTQFSEQDLLSAFATLATQQCMKFLQDGKLVLLCVQNDQTDMNEEAMQGVKEFVADDRFRTAAEIVSLDPSAEAERPFLKDLQVDAATKTAVTIFLVPPGSPIATFEGATTKDQLAAELEKAGSCGPGGVCGPGGCAPK